MSKDKTKDFQEFIKQDFDVVEDYKASKELTPEKAIDKIHDYITDRCYDMELEVSTIKQALTNYANTVERLEGLVKHCDKSIEVYKDSYNGVVSLTMKSMKEKLTKVLEGKANENN
jgi:hypothetical protein